MADERTPRELETRETEARPQEWKPPQVLPDPKPQAGWVFRWVRTSVLGAPDPLNVSQRLREGWEPVRAQDHPEIQFVKNNKSQYKDGIEIGDLLLCKMPEQVWEQRQAYYRKLATDQLSSIDSNFMRENHPSMPLIKPERHTRIQFGRPKG